MEYVTEALIPSSLSTARTRTTSVPTGCSSRTLMTSSCGSTSSGELSLTSLMETRTATRALRGVRPGPGPLPLSHTSLSFRDPGARELQSLLRNKKIAAVFTDDNKTYIFAESTRTTCKEHKPTVSYLKCVRKVAVHV